MEDFPPLVVPDNPETGAIEGLETSPAIQIGKNQWLNTTALLPVKVQEITNAPETFIASRESEESLQRVKSTQATSQLLAARFEPVASESSISTPNLLCKVEEPVETLVDVHAIEDRSKEARPYSDHVASLSSKDYKAMAKRAAATAMLDRLAAGNKSVFDATMDDIAALGIGMELYFLSIKYLSWAFLIMGIVSLPAVLVNYSGSGVTTKMVDPLQLAYASLGNQGVNPDIASDPTQCLPLGKLDCTGVTVNTPFTTNPQTVAWIVTSSDAIYSLIFLLVYLLFRRRARRAIDAHQNEHLTPAKYAIFVRGLPPDATAREVLEHFNHYDPTQDETYYPIWLGCCWGRRRRRVKHSLSRGAMNCNVVRDLEHLWRPDDLSHPRSTTANQQPRLKSGAQCRLSTVHLTTENFGFLSRNDSKHDELEMYIGTWIAEVSIAHPTGGLLRTFLAMEVLTRKISEAHALVTILSLEKDQAEVALQLWVPPLGKKNPKKPKSTFKRGDESLLQVTTAKLARLQAAMAKKTSKLKALKLANKQLADEAATVVTQTAMNKTKPKINKDLDAKPFDLKACECAFVVFNNLESRRRCLQDYRRSNLRLPLKFQPKALRFRNAQYPLTVLAAPEPSNILWENLEVTTKSRRLRRAFTNAVTFLLLLLSGVIISAAQSAQQAHKDKAAPAGLCEVTLPEIFYGGLGFLDVKGVTWELEWNPTATCPRGDHGEMRYHVAYSNGILNEINVQNSTSPVNELHRCTNPCVSERSNTKCNTLECFNGAIREETGKDCETFLASYVLYCLCTAQIQTSIAKFGVIRGSRKLWSTFTPCRGFLTDFIVKNAFVVLASVVVVIVNIVLKSTLRAFASFERHTSESAKASAVALKMFAAQFLNTAIIVLVVNAALSVSSIPVIGDLFRGKYNDFQRDWYPTVGLGITMTMLINAILPQTILLVQLCVISPLKRCLARRSVRTQERMDKLYAGPKFDLAVRYPTVLNSVFVTLVFCGGSPVLLFIAALACSTTYWIDKLSLLWLYSVKTAYDEALGETILGLLPWALVAHLAFSCWMYGNTDLLKSPMLNLSWGFKLFGLSSDGGTNTEDIYNKVVTQATMFDPLGKNGFIVKVLRVNVMLMFLLFVLVLVGILLSAVWERVLLPVIRNTFGRIFLAFWRCFLRRNVIHPTISANAPPLNATRMPCGFPLARSAKIAIDPISTDASTSITIHPLTDAIAGKEDASINSKLSMNKSLAWTPKETTRPIAPVGVGPSQVVLPEFTNIFRTSVDAKFRPDAKLGFKRNPDSPSQLVRYWQEEAVSNGYRRNPKDLMRTWEAIQAPVKTYAIEANAKYRLAVAELVAASRRAHTFAETSGIPPTFSSAQRDMPGGKSGE